VPLLLLVVVVEVNLNLQALSTFFVTVLFPCPCLLPMNNVSFFLEHISPGQWAPKQISKNSQQRREVLMHEVGVGHATEPELFMQMMEANVWSRSCLKSVTWEGYL
jgi:hypothetical protein